MNKDTNYCADFLSSVEADGMHNPLLFQIREAVKFRLPDGGVTLDFAKVQGKKQYADTAIAANYITTLKLPYDLIALEVPYSEVNTKTIIVVKQQADGSIIYVPLSKITTPDMGFWFEYGLTGIIEPNFNGRYTVDENFTTNPDRDEYRKYAMSLYSYAVLSFIAALQCSNVKLMDDVAPAKLNKSRIKKGKEPLFDYKVLTIDTQSATTKKGAANASEPTHSKREHLRRGHIRRLESKTVWVNPCVVGDSSKGNINKEYRVL